jgi:hypothetical protein
VATLAALRAIPSLSHGRQTNVQQLVTPEDLVTEQGERDND